MKMEPAVRAQVRAIAVGVGLLTVLMISVFLIIGKFDWTVLTGALLGASTAVINFYLMALTLQKAANDMPAMPSDETEDDGEDGAASSDRDDEKDPPLSEEARRGRSRYRLSYALRMLGLGAVAVLGVVLPWFNTYAALIPLLFPGLVIRVIGARMNKGG